MQLAGEHLDRDRPPVGVAQQSVDDLRQAGPPVPRVPTLPERARATLEVTRGHVVQRRLPVTQVAGSETILDPVLALHEPVHRRVEVILIRSNHAALLRQG